VARNALGSFFRFLDIDLANMRRQRKRDLMAACRAANEVG
jgi:hypothetical protein